MKKIENINQEGPKYKAIYVMTMKDACEKQKRINLVDIQTS